MENNNLFPPYTVGVDIGGTNTAFAIVDSVGHIIDSSSFPTATPTVESFADKLALEVRGMIRRNGMDGSIGGVGIGAPCANAQTGCIEAATDLPWPSPVPLVNMMESRLGVDVTISNDANAAAIGEMTYGAAAGMKNFIVLTLGTGVGSGIVCDGHLLSGTRGFAGELGHVTFPFAAGRVCGCGREGCLQTVASAKGILETVRQMLDGNDRPSALREIPSAELTAKMVADAALAGDAVAGEALDFTGRCLGRAAAEFAAFTDPEAIILFGGVARAGELLLAPMRKEFARSALHLYRDRVRIMPAALGGAGAALLGAAALPYM